jgi:elongation factor Ts
MAITASQVKELRESTGAGMMDAKRALEEVGGDFEKAVDWLRTKGLAKAAKKAGRTAAEGLVAVAVRGGRGVAVEVNSETDFVAKNEGFQKMVASFAQAALDVADLDALKKAVVNGKTVEDTLTEAIATIGENMTLRRMAVAEGDAVASYIHNAAGEGLGKIGVLVALKGADKGIGKQIAMHVAAANPVALNETGVASDIIERERNVAREKALASGKPEAVVEKIVTSALKSYFAEVTLLEQKFVMDPSKSVAQVAKEAGSDVLSFVRMAVGEGIEKEEAPDFAAEVAAMVKG